MDAIWTIFIISVLVIGVVLESYALRTGRTTLSRYVWKASKAWPPLPFIIGSVCGGAAVHFWWPWCPV